MATDRTTTRAQYHALRQLAGRIQRSSACMMTDAEFADSPSQVRDDIMRRVAEAQQAVPHEVTSVERHMEIVAARMRRTHVLLSAARRKALADALKQVGCL